jgi:hypothetical protein
MKAVKKCEKEGVGIREDHEVITDKVQLKTSLGS